MKLKCPKCSNELNLIDSTYKCNNNHCYDLGKSKYLNLYLSNTKDHGDNKEMVKARANFLNQNYYLNLANKINEIIKSKEITNLVDFACGTGYYTNIFKSTNNFEIYGLDISKEAIIYASKSNKLVNYIVASTFDSCFYDNSVDCITNIFAPIKLDEVNRILKKDKYFIFVSPNPNHLLQLKQAVYDNVYLNEVTTLVHDNLELVESHDLNYQISIDNNQGIKDLFLMTPYYYKTSISDMAKLGKLENLTTTIDFHIQVFKKK